MIHRVKYLVLSDYYKLFCEKTKVKIVAGMLGDKGLEVPLHPLNPYMSKGNPTTSVEILISFPEKYFPLLIELKFRLFRLFFYQN